MLTTHIIPPHISYSTLLYSLLWKNTLDIISSQHQFSTQQQHTPHKSHLFHPFSIKFYFQGLKLSSIVSVINTLDTAQQVHHHLTDSSFSLVHFSFSYIRTHHTHLYCTTSYVSFTSPYLHIIVHNIIHQLRARISTPVSFILIEFNSTVWYIEIIIKIITF